MNQTAAVKELRAFQRFAEHAPLRIIPNSIRSMPTPEPDILCQTEAGEQIAFELVELIDEDYARGLAVLFKTKSMLDDLPDRLPRDVRDALEQRFPNGAFISFDFSNELRLRGREGAAVEALRWLLGRPEPIEDHNDVDGELRACVQIVHLHPWRWGLHFDSSSYNRLRDPTLERLERKFAISYETDHPVELLMYTEMDLLLPEDIWRPTVEPYVIANLQASPFRRVWLLKTGAGTIDFIYPALS